MNGQVLDCPWCGGDRPDHLCQNCYSEMVLEECWRWQGFCSEKCLQYITDVLPSIRRMKAEKGIKCPCDEPLCGKCLSINCNDDACPTHILSAKAAWLQRNTR